MPLAKRTIDMNRQPKEVLGTLMVGEYKYLGIRFKSNMRMDATLNDKARMIRDMKNNKCWASRTCRPD